MMIKIISAVLFAFVVSASLVFAEGPTLNVKDVPVDQDSTISIRKGNSQRPLDPDYEITSGTEEISGEPLAGLKESRDSWKAACADWKKEMREMNGAALMALSCGTPKAEKDSSSRVTQTSSGTYKVRVKIRESH